MAYKSYLEQVLSEGKFAITAEVGPPKGSDPNIIRQKGEILNNYADAYNVTDNQTAVVRMSSLASCIILQKMNLEPIMQITCRDRNRIALQSDILGASALGIKNILCLTGDHQSLGNHPESKGVYDIDSIQLIQIIKNMRDNGIFQNGDKILYKKPDIFIGAVANPFSDPLEYRVDRLEKKLEAGVNFIQTQSVFNIDKFKKWIDEIRSRNIDKKVYILAGTSPLKSLKMTNRMKNYVPGVDIPDYIVKRMKNTTNPEKEGFNIAVELINEIKKIKGIHGLHITALFWENIIPSICIETGLYPRNR
jgi:methylenetetrahydrofolate reductase (NADPH)